jgi:hypothetical protein
MLFALGGVMGTDVTTNVASASEEAAAPSLACDSALL